MYFFEKDLISSTLCSRRHTLIKACDEAVTRPIGLVTKLTQLTKASKADRQAAALS